MKRQLSKTQKIQIITSLLRKVTDTDDTIFEVDVTRNTQFVKFNVKLIMRRNQASGSVNGDIDV